MKIDFDTDTQVQHVRGKTELADPGLIWIFVWLGQEPGEGDRFFILRHAEVQDAIYEAHTEWLDAHGGRRPRAPNSRHCAIRLDQLVKHENDWSVVERELKRRSPNES